MDLPSVCKLCCGDHAHIKMIRQTNGEECKVCTRPFDVYRWNISQAANKSKKTVVCKTCARARNCCQSCMLDIKYLIPLDIRDTALKMAGIENNYGSSKNREVKAIMADKMEARFRKDEGKTHDLLTKLAGRFNLKTVVAPQKRKEPPKVDVSRVVNQLPFGGSLTPPTDASITSFFVFGLLEDTPQYAVEEVFEQYGRVKSCVVNLRARCGYVTMATRAAAEAAATKVQESALPGMVVVDKSAVRVVWGRPRPLGTAEEAGRVGAVVQKVMRQLAERGAAPTKKDHSDTSSAGRRARYTDDVEL